MISRSPSLQASSTSSPTTAEILSEASPSDLDALGGADRQHRAHPFLKQRIITAVGVFHARLLRQRDRALAETLEHQILDVPLFGEFDRGLDAIARIAGTRSYPDRSHHFSPK